MSEENTPDSGALTDEQIAEQFPGQDVAHIRSMVEKMSNSEKAAATPEADIEPVADPADAVEYPEYIPEKFRQGTVEEAHQKMAESYAQLEKSRGAASDDASDPPAGDTPADPAPKADIPPDTLSDALTQVAKDGTVTEETYKALEEKGMDRSVVNDYIAGQQAIADQLVSRIHTEAGGAEEYADLMQWADTNWTDAEIDAYDAVINSGNEASIKLALAGLKAARGTTPNLRQGGDGKPTHSGYQSKAEMTEDIRNPKYRTDPAYRKMVEQKIAASNIW